MARNAWRRATFTSSTGRRCSPTAAFSTFPLVPLLPLVLIAVLASPFAFAQMRRSAQGVKQVFPYDGRMVFTRLYFGGSGLASFGSRGYEAWSHDYPAAERNLTATIDFLTNAR